MKIISSPTFWYICRWSGSNQKWPTYADFFIMKFQKNSNSAVFRGFLRVVEINRNPIIPEFEFECVRSSGDLANGWLGWLGWSRWIDVDHFSYCSSSIFNIYSFSNCSHHLITHRIWGNSQINGIIECKNEKKKFYYLFNRAQLKPFDKKRIRIKK